MLFKAMGERMKPTFETQADYRSRELKNRIHGYRVRISRLETALRTARNETIARGGSETQFARQCGLSLQELHEMVGSFVTELDGLDLE
jgi:hypothetical protein